MIKEVTIAGTGMNPYHPCRESSLSLKLNEKQLRKIRGRITERTLFSVLSSKQLTLVLNMFGKSTSEERLAKVEVRLFVEENELKTVMRKHERNPKKQEYIDKINEKTDSINMLKKERDILVRRTIKEKPDQFRIISVREYKQNEQV